MQLHIELAWIVAVVLVSIRIGAVFIMTPVFGTMQIPIRIKVLFVLALSATMVAAASAKLPVMDLKAGDLVLAALGELMIGALFSFGLFAGFGAFLFGGRFLDMQIGFGVASLIDPATRNQSSLLGSAFNMLAVFLFFAMDGHHMILRGIAYSLEKFPPGTFSGEFELAFVAAVFGSMFTFGFALVAPIVFCLFLIDIGMAVMSRTMPQVNIFFLAIALKIFVGLMLLAMSIEYMAPLVHRVFRTIFGYWERILG